MTTALIYRRKTVANRIAASVAYVLIATISVGAASLSDYKKRVENARSAADQLFENIGTPDGVTERELKSHIRQFVPPSEKVVWPGGEIETANGWLAEKLEEFEDETDERSRSSILTEISERLHAISNSVEELENATRGSRTKDEDKQKLAEILRRQEYQKPPPKEPSLFQKWLDKVIEWLAKMWPSGSPIGSGEAASELRSLQFWLQILIYALVIGLVGFLLYKFAPFLSCRFKGLTRLAKKDRVILGERIEAGQSASSLFAEAERLALGGDLRGAIRKGYIALLCDLSDRKVVRLARHKTNRDYLREVRKNRGLFENMKLVTGNFESSWYGLRTAEPADWEAFRQKYHEVVAR